MRKLVINISYLILIWFLGILVSKFIIHMAYLERGSFQMGGEWFITAIILSLLIHHTWRRLQ